MKRVLLPVLILVLPALSFASDEAESLFYAGNKFYEQGQYEKAIGAYEKILSLGKESWPVYFNLGNAYYKLQRPGPAILNYERALKLNPKNEDIRFNLDLANLAIVDRIPTPPKPAWLSIAEALVYSLPLNFIIWTAILIYIVYMFIWALQQVRPALISRRVRRIFSGACLPLLTVLLLLFAFRWYKLETEQYGVVLVPEVSATSAPVADATEVFALHEGTKLRVEKTSENWARIRLIDGKVGWIPARTLGKI